MGDSGSELERAWPVLLPTQKGCFSENSKDEKARCLSPNANSRFQVGELVPGPSPRGREQNALPKASDQGETPLLGPLLLGSAWRTSLQPSSGEGRALMSHSFQLS